jgi:hypothetical protein
MVNYEIHGLGLTSNKTTLIKAEWQIGRHPGRCWVLRTNCEIVRDAPFWAEFIRVPCKMCWLVGFGLNKFCCVVVCESDSLW